MVVRVYLVVERIYAKPMLVRHIIRIRSWMIDLTQDEKWL